MTSAFFWIAAGYCAGGLPGAAAGGVFLPTNLLIVAGASIFSWLVAFEHFPDTVVSFLVSELMRKKGWIGQGDYRLDL